MPPVRPPADFCIRRRMLKLLGRNKWRYTSVNTPRSDCPPLSNCVQVMLKFSCRHAKYHVYVCYICSPKNIGYLDKCQKNLSDMAALTCAFFGNISLLTSQTWNLAVGRFAIAWRGVLTKLVTQDFPSVVIGSLNRAAVFRIKQVLTQLTGYEKNL